MNSRRLEKLDLGAHSTRRYFNVDFATFVAAADHGKP
jgi:hypothetical protein